MKPLTSNLDIQSTDQEAQEKYTHPYWGTGPGLYFLYGAEFEITTERIKMNYQARLDRTKERYERYLESKWWKQRQATAILQANGQCDKCATTERLRVHHLTYERLGAELDGDLRVLCETCHRIEHSKEPKSRIKYLYKELMLIKPGTTERDKVFQEIRAERSKEFR